MADKDNIEAYLEKIYAKAQEIVNSCNLTKKYSVYATIKEKNLFASELPAKEKAFSDNYWAAVAKLKTYAETLKFCDKKIDYPAFRLCRSAISYISEMNGKKYENWLDSDRTYILSNSKKAMKR